jgi:hypothetical protein
MNKISVLIDDGHVITRICEVPDLTTEQVKRSILAALDDSIPQPGRPGEPVAVMTIDREELARYKDKGADQEIQPGQVFESALALSLALGYASKDVHLALSKAKKAGELEATLRGVTFKYVKDLRD